MAMHDACPAHAYKHAPKHGPSMCASHATEQDITERIRTPLYRKRSELRVCVQTRKVGAP